MATNQADRNPQLIKWDDRIKKNRDFCGGEWDIKQAGKLYMPLPDALMTQKDYEAFLKRVATFPAAAHIHDSFVNLMLREDPVLESETLAPIKRHISINGDDLETFSEHLVSEALITGYFGILVDHLPEDQKPDGVNASNAVEMGWYPMLAPYPFESILDHKRLRIGDGYQYVKLSDSENQWRELELINGVYTVTTHTRNDDSKSPTFGEFIASRTVPRRNGKPLDFIPFEIIKRHNAQWPKKALLEGVVNLNCSHYIQEGDLSLALFHCAGPQKVAINPPRNVDTNGKYIPNVYPAGSNRVVELWGDDNRTPDFRFNEFKGTGVAEIRQKLTEIKSQISAAGSRMLADEKAVAEAAETLEIRRTSENANLAGEARSTMRKFEKVLRWQAWWMGAERKDDPNTRFTLNLDFAPSKTTPEELDAYGIAIERGILTKRDVFFLTREGGLLPDTKTWEDHQAELEQQAIDEPIAMPRASTGHDLGGF